MRLSALFAAATLTLLAAPGLQAESVFNFESSAQHASLPFALKVNGLTATFTGTASVCSSVGLGGPMFTRLTGNTLIQGLCTDGNYGALTVTFSQPLSKLTFALAINGQTSVPVTVTFTEHGTVVGKQTIKPTVPVLLAKTGSPEASVTFTGIFDAVSVSSTGLLALDNLDAIPAQISPSTPISH